MGVESRVAVITGASSGIGAALARQLAAGGTRVGLLSLPDGNLDTQVERIRDDGGLAVAESCDVADAEETLRAMTRLADELGPIDLLICSAGIGLGTPTSASLAEPMERLVRVNFLGVVNAIDAVLPEMSRRRQGHLVGISSLSSYRGQPIVSGYCATKAAVATLLEGLRIELRTAGIAVTTVRPGFVRTPMTEGIHAPRFMMEVEPAARLILEGIAAKRREISFPWPATTLMGVARRLPGAAYERLAASLMKDKVVLDEPQLPEPLGVDHGHSG